MITVISRPYGHKLGPAVQGTVSDFSGKALITTLFSHGLVQGDWVYIESTIDAYNGYMKVADHSATQFTFTPDTLANQVDYYSSVTLEYSASVLDHGVNAVHNPIVYELASDIFPYNSIDEQYFPATVSSTENDNGYTKLILSGNILSETAFIDELMWITIGDAGPYQILTKISDSIYVINLAYDSDNDFPGPVVRYLYNYCIHVDVYCGFGSSHPWHDYKPYELACSLKFTPPEGNSVKFSIAEAVKGYMNTRNKPDLSTLPNNLDFGCGFYIVYYESYDNVEDGEIVTYESERTSDQSEFEGLAINAMMPFKSMDAGAMSDYVDFDVYLADWLVLQDTMTWIVGLFMDLSFINIHEDTDILILINGELSQTLDNPGVGVLRIPLTFETAGEYCVQAWVPSNPGSPEVTNDITADIPLKGEWYSLSTAVGQVAWTIDAQPDVHLTGGTPGAPKTSEYLTFDYDFVSGRQYTISIRLGASTAGTPLNPRSTRLSVFDASNAELAYGTGIVTTGSYEWTTVNFTAPDGAVKAGIRINSGSSDRTVVWEGDPTTDVVVTEVTPEVPATDAAQITESFCITVVDECDNTIVPGMDDIRLLEDGDFRLLE